MNSIPILLKGPLVRRTLDGRKTQTRRLITTVRGIGRVTEFQRSSTPGDDWIMRDQDLMWNHLRDGELLARCPYGERGDRLWVRETWRHNCYCVPGEGLVPGVVHKATFSGLALPSAPWGLDTESNKWRPAIFMPREACRLELLIQDVRIARLQDITPDAVHAEGVADLCLEELLEMGASRSRLRAGVLGLGYQVRSVDNGMDGLLHRFLRSAPLRDRWKLSWNLINGHRPGARWADNPWVWVIQYKSRRHDEP